MPSSIWHEIMACMGGTEPSHGGGHMHDDAMLRGDTLIDGNKGAQQKKFPRNNWRKAALAMPWL